MSTEPADAAMRGVMTRALDAYHAGRMDETARLCEEIARTRPKNFGAAYLLAAAHSARRDWRAALLALDRAIAIHPAHADAHDNRTVALLELGRFDDAVASAHRALEIEPAHARAANNLAMALHGLARHEEALACLDRALRSAPDFPEAHNNRGNVLQRLERFEEALEAYEKAISLKPEYAEAHNNRGAVLQELKRYPQALVSFERALTVRPGYAAAHNNRGVTLHTLDRYDEALQAFDQAVTHNKKYADAWYNRANTLRRLGRLDDAMDSYTSALRFHPAHANALANAGMTELLRGNFVQGWRMYEGRWKTPELAPLKARFDAKGWLGNEDIRDKRLLVYAEQGHGDTLQFCRYLPLARERCRELIVEMQPSLVPLLRPVFPGITLIPGGEPLPMFERACPLLSLPLAFETTLTTIPQPSATVPPSASCATWTTRLGPSRAPRIGLAWRGSPRHSQDFRRSLPFQALRDLLDLPFEYHCLHQESVSHETDGAPVFWWGSELRNFADTAALIHHMDLVISVDTAVAHVAASMGKPTWIILSVLPDFRWLLEREDSPWYPSARLFRQTREGDWQAPLARLRTALGERFGHAST